MRAPRQSEAATEFCFQARRHAEKPLQTVLESLFFSNPAAAGLISDRMASLDKETKFRLLKTIVESRHADLREQNLNRQGKGHFHVSGMRHCLGHPARWQKKCCRDHSR